MPISVKEKYIAYINSYRKLVSSDSTSNFSVLVNLPKNNDFDRVVVSQLSIPKSYYLVQNGYNTFIINENGVDKTITINVGNYSKTTFLTELKRAFTSSSSPALSWVYAITFDTPTGKLNFTVSGNTSQPCIKTTTNLFEQLGFNSNSSNFFVSNSLTSTNCIKLQLEDTLLILSDMSNALSGVLQEVYCNNSDFSNITFNQYNAELYSKNFIRNTNNVSRFTLTDENFRPIDLNGLNMVMTLIFYKHNDAQQSIISDAPPTSLSNFIENNNKTELFS